MYKKAYSAFCGSDAADPLCSNVMLRKMYGESNVISQAKASGRPRRLKGKTNGGLNVMSQAKASAAPRRPKAKTNGGSNVISQAETRGAPRQLKAKPAPALCFDGTCVPRVGIDPRELARREKEER